MIYMVYILAGLAGGVLTGMAGLTAAMVLTPILCSVCGWSGYDAVTLSLIANVPSAMVTCWTFYKNGNIQMKKGMPMAAVAFAGAVVGSYLGYLFSMVSENGISYFVIISNLFMALKFFMPTKEKKETLTAAEEKKARAMLQRLFEYYMKHPEMLPEDFLPQLSFDGMERTVCDYIAGMTDNYAVDKYTEIFIPTGWHVRG